MKLTKAELARITIVEEVENFGDSMSMSIADLAQRYGGDAILEVETYYDYSDTYASARIRRYREETDEEYDARITDLKNQKLLAAARKRSKAKAIEDKDREIFNCLREKYQW